ncbi:retrovirus-related pol polyprotein from transposon TNT 1-94, partial [Tanacetum coccineum]
LDKVLWKSNNDKSKHSEICFCSLVAINKKLNTQDRVVNWNKVDVLKCPLCCFIKDDHDHLFFGCDYSIKVWKNFKGLMRLDVAPDNLFSIVDYISSRPIDFDFIPSHNDLGSDLDVSSPSGDRNKIYDPGICIEVESMRFLATLSPVIDTLLPFSSENEDKVFNHGVLASKEKSPPFSSHRGFKASKLFHHKIPMIAPDYEASRARGFVLRSLELQSSASLWESNIQSYRLTFIFMHT